MKTTEEWKPIIRGEIRKHGIPLAVRDAIHNIDHALPLEYLHALERESAAKVLEAAAFPDLTKRASDMTIERLKKAWEKWLPMSYSRFPALCMVTPYRWVWAQHALALATDWAADTEGRRFHQLAIIHEIVRGALGEKYPHLDINMVC